MIELVIGNIFNYSVAEFLPGAVLITASTASVVVDFTQSNILINFKEKHDFRISRWIIFKGLPTLRFSS